jgi:hypothetical protein
MPLYVPESPGRYAHRFNGTAVLSVRVVEAGGVPSRGGTSEVLRDSSARRKQDNVRGQREPRTSG